MSAQVPTSTPPDIALLSCRGLHAGYGHMAVIRDVDLSVRPGEITALLGPNGAGKTTTLLTLAGVLPPLRGVVRWLDDPDPPPVHRRVRQGLAVVPEERSVIASLTTLENLRLGPGDPRLAFEIFPELEPLSGRRAGLLSGGEQQMLTLGRALAARPRVLVADEVSLGLAPLVVTRLLRAVRDAADSGVGVLLVEQQVEQALVVADQVLIMNHGEVRWAGDVADLPDSADLRALYLR